MSFDPLVLLLFLPSASVLGWMLINRIVARRTSTYMVIQLILLDLFMLFTADGLYSIPGLDPKILAVSHLFTVFSGPCVIPLVWMYFHQLRHGTGFRVVHLLWLLIPVSLVFSAVSLTDTIGVQQLAPFLADIFANGQEVVKNYKSTSFEHYYTWSHTIFRIAVGVELFAAVIALLAYVITDNVRLSHLVAHFHKDAPIKVTELQTFTFILPALFVFFKILLSKQYIDQHLWVSIVLAVIVSFGLFLFCRCAWLGARKTVTRTQALHVMMYNYNPAIKGPIVEIMIEELLEEADQSILLRTQDRIGDLLRSDAITPKEMNAVKQVLFSTSSSAWDDSLLTRFRTLMLSDQLFLRPSLSLQDVADRLNTNKTYISKLVNNTYNMSFPEFLNTLRVDYAQQYIRNHPNAKQEEIAKSCGFLSASTFNNIFRKLTGVTPKMWAVKSLEPRE